MKPLTLQITKSAKNNTFINCVINGSTKIAGSGTKMIKTKFNELKQDHPVVYWLSVISSLITVGSVVFVVTKSLVRFLVPFSNTLLNTLNYALSKVKMPSITLTDSNSPILGSVISSIATIVAALLAVWIAFSQIKKQLEHKIIYEAWTDLQKKLYELSQKLTDYDSKIQWLTYYFKTIDNNLVNGGDARKYQLNKWNEFEEAFSSLQHSYVNFLISFESYEIILLPLTQMKKSFIDDFRKRVLDTHMDFAEKVFPEMYGISTSQTRAISDNEINKYWGSITEISAFIDDFRIELQNLTLGKILKKCISRRTPEIECEILTRKGFIKYSPSK